jgi:hypothetical protein
MVRFSVRFLGVLAGNGINLANDPHLCKNYFQLFSAPPTFAPNYCSNESVTAVLTLDTKKS